MKSFSAGTGALTGRARRHLGAGRPLDALQLTDVALAGDADNAGALGICKAALERLAEVGTGTNLSETMWLKAEITDLESRIEAARRSQRLS